MTKPPYQPLTMAQVRGAPLTGLTHVSTFSGAGGTCLGFRLAGFQTLLANDIDPHACRMYARNLTSPIDASDIRQITPDRLLTRLDLNAGALDVFEGSPPCTAFSTAGTGAAGWGQTKEHAGRAQTNIEDLFFEWLRLLEGLRPRAFVAENVAGLVKGVAKGYFKEILQRMKRLQYRTEARLLNAQWLGVPQYRTRIIFVGIRADLEQAPRFPVPLSYRYSVREAVPWLKAARHDRRAFHIEEFIDRPPPPIMGAPNAYLVKDLDPVVGQQIVRKGFRRVQTSLDDACPAVLKGPMYGGTWVLASGARRKFTIPELKRICSFPDDFELSGSYAKQWARLGNSVPPLMAYAIGAAVRDVLLEVDARAQKVRHV